MLAEFLSSLIKNATQRPVAYEACLGSQETEKRGTRTARDEAKKTLPLSTNTHSAAVDRTRVRRDNDKQLQI